MHCMSAFVQFMIMQARIHAIASGNGSAYIYFIYIYIYIYIYIMDGRSISYIAIYNYSKL